MGKITKAGGDGIEIDGDNGAYTGNKGFDFDDTVGGGLNSADETNSFGTIGP